MKTRPDTSYRGRFAPSPTGHLHFGSLVAAVGSYLEARRHNGSWLVRMEDLDPPRATPGATDGILRTLETYGFEWDETVLFQSKRTAAYAAALDRLHAAGAVYPCACSRKEVADSGIGGLEGPVYPGTCRAGLRQGRAARTWRVHTRAAVVAFSDLLQGEVSQQLGRDIGDFVLKRGDGLFAYQLAVVVDDAAQGITHVMRGSDLLLSTPRQIHLQGLLGLPTPAYAHLPVAVNTAGKKLSKQTRARALNTTDPVPTLWRALQFLGQNPPSELRRAALRELWQWAQRHWNPAALRGHAALPARHA